MDRPAVSPAAAPSTPRPAPPAQPFRWIAGIEGSYVPHLGIDQYAWTQHDRFWRDDFRRAARELGCRWLRYSLPWHQIETAPGRFDWSWADERFAWAQELGLKLILDLVHFGVPTWLPDAFADADLPLALERYARAFGERYRGREAVVPTVCPVNEPLITALFSGDIGLWPPFGRGLDTYVVVLSRVAEAMVRSIRALRQTMPGAEIIVCDSLEVAFTHEPHSSEKTSPHLREALGADVARRMERRHVVMDLVLGRVDEGHYLHGWLRQHGFPAHGLSWFRRHAQTVDLVGLDYYFHTEVELYTTPEGHYRQRNPAEPVGLYRAAQDYWHRYQIPLMITETSVTGSDADRIGWLERSVADVRRLRADGFPVFGYTWWPMIDHVDWDGAMLHQTNHIHPVGIYRLERRPDGSLARVPTGLHDAYRALIVGGEAAAGPLAPALPPPPAPGETTLPGAVPLRTAASAPAPAAPAPAKAPVPPAGWPLVVYGRQDWEENWRRPQHLLARLQRRHPVLYVEPARWDWNGTERATAGGSPAGRATPRAVPGLPWLHVLRPEIPAAWREEPARAAAETRRVVDAARSAEPLARWFGPAAAPAVAWYEDAAAAAAFTLPGAAGADADPRRAPVRAIVYDCPETAPAGADAGAAHRALLGSADLVLFRSRGQLAAAQARGEAGTPRGRWLPDGVDARQWVRLGRGRQELPPDSRFIARPTLGYLGTVDERLDYELVRSLSEACPEMSLVMVGPVTGAVAPERLPRRGNIFWLGRRPAHRLVEYARGIDVFILPYRTGPDQAFRLPTKLPEALLSGRPVVATDLPEVRAQFGEFVELAADAADFAARCRRACQHPDPKRGRAAMRLAAKRDWRVAAREFEAAVDGLRSGRG